MYPTVKMDTKDFELECLRLEVKALQTDKAELEKKVCNLMGHNRRLQDNYDALFQAYQLSMKARFGASSEKNQMPDGQMNLFGQELDALITSQLPDRTVSVKEHKRPVRVKGDRQRMINGLETETEEFILNSGEAVCDLCGSEMKEIARKVVRREVVFTKPSIKVREYVQATYKCVKCGKNDTNPFDHFVKAPVPAPLLSHPYASASLVSWIMYQKFAMSVPLYRQEKDWNRMLFPLQRNRMANWIIRCSDTYLAPIYDCMKIELTKRDIVMSDETTWQCNEEPGRKASSRAYIWVHRTTSLDEKPAIILYDYTRTRNGGHAKEYLKEFSGYSVTDAYAGYEKVEGITRCLCFSHLRRYYLDAIPLGPNKKPLPGAAAAKGLAYCDKLFRLERKWKNLSPEERQKKRMVYSRPVLDAFFLWAKTVETNQPLLRRAIGYTRNHEEYFRNFLLDGQIPISNNSSLYTGYFYPHLFRKGT